ncbi:MAG: hypothetical protein M1830_006997 [Pleopsidium flavum]|nr:MAG: hypothetical protein M1830_006997 [Pleopsidium flavum]
MKRRLWELNCGILGLLLSEGAAFVITGALKNATGKPRPDLIDRCQPLAGSADPPVYGLSSSDICKPTNHAILKDGFRSFPSGHSSSAFAGLFYLSLYLAAKLHVLDNRGEVWKTFVVLVPTLGAALIAVSRIMDARHHPFDVISGSLLGTVVAWCSYRQYFGPISESWRKGRAYPIRTWAMEPAGPDSVAVDREISRHDGVEPLRAPGGTDEEQSIPTAGTVGPPAAASSAENVFRQQISQSQRRRHGEENSATWPAAEYRSVTEGRNPFPVGSGTRTQQTRRNDGYWSSSSEDNDEGYELRQQYTLNDPQRQGLHHVGYDTRQEDFGGDTAYHPPASTTSQPAHPLPAAELYGVGNGRDIASPISPVRSPPLQHVGYSRQAENATRGVDLVETYAK